MASTSVDLPLPFSPAKSVTRESSFSSSRYRMAGIENGYASRSSISSRLRASERTKRSSLLRVDSPGFFASVIGQRLGSERDGTNHHALRVAARPRQAGGPDAAHATQGLHTEARHHIGLAFQVATNSGG